MIKSKVQEQLRRHSAHRQSLKIDKEIKVDTEIVRNAYRILIVGNSSSGKTTIMEQIQDIHSKLQIIDDKPGPHTSHSKPNKCFEDSPRRPLVNFVGLSEYWIHVNQINYNITKIGEGGPRLTDFKKTKWACTFDNLSVICFVADCSTFDRLTESLLLLEKFWPIVRRHLLRRVRLLLIINKEDLLLENIKSGEFNLNDHFPEFSDYARQNHTTDAADSNDDDDEMVKDKAKNFILDKFLIIISENLGKASVLDLCYPHFTCGVDSENVERLFENLQYIVQGIKQENERCMCLEEGYHTPANHSNDWMLFPFFCSCILCCCGCPCCTLYE